MVNEERKLRMIYDEFDSCLDQIVKNFQQVIGTLVDKLLSNQMKKYSELKINCERIHTTY